MKKFKIFLFSIISLVVIFLVFVYQLYYYDNNMPRHATGAIPSTLEDLKKIPLYNFDNSLYLENSEKIE